MKDVQVHVSIKKRRTTITLDRIISDLIAIKLGQKPGTQAGQAAVRGQVQGWIDGVDDPLMVRVSQLVAARAVLFLVDPKTGDDYWAYATGEEQ
jgi:hypothetical protein